MTYETTTTRKAGWLVPTGLLALGFVPIVAGAARLSQLSIGVPDLSDSARYFAAPVPIVLHIVSVSLFAVLGAFQFAGGLRRRRPGWHRAAGRVLVPAGLVVALTGLWMAVYYPRLAGDGDLLEAFRLVVGTAMLLSIVLGFAAIRRGDVARHRAWMTRGYAIGMGAGTQVLTNLPWVVIYGPAVGTPRALLLAAGWAINITVAEWIIRRRPPQLLTRFVS
jgi:uncharacterized membrane protein